MIIYASVAKRLWPELMALWETKGKVNTVTTYDETVQDSGFLRFHPKYIYFSNRGDFRVRGKPHEYRRVSLFGAEIVDIYGGRYGKTE